MQNDKAKFKNEFRECVYKFALDVIRFVDHLLAEQSIALVQIDR
jgi:hypothetical protein